MGLDRFELSTSPLSGVRSNRLSYRPGTGVGKGGAGGVIHTSRVQPGPSCETLIPNLPEEDESRAGPAVLRKEVIQPQVPLRRPCYDFTPVADLTVVGCLPCGLAHRLRVKPTPMV